MKAKLEAAVMNAIRGTGIWLKGQIEEKHAPPGFLSDQYEWCYRVILTDGTRSALIYHKKSWVEETSDEELYLYFKTGIEQWQSRERVN